jgi:serine/threonine-protein kinase
MTPTPLVGSVLDGKFQIEKPLASGAAGDVYEALHLGLRTRVAVKVLRPGPPETAEIRRKRFMREARVAARIRSDHVVRVFDIVAPEHGPTYIVMELLHGETLAQRIRRVGALPSIEAVDYIVQAAKPLGEMHDTGIVHRDVKPSNLFLARDADGRERIKLLDFGVAAFQQPIARSESSITLSEVIVGTPRYMAPEQVRSSKHIDARVDVWALGVTLYELLVGTPPFEGQTVLAVLNQIENQEPWRLSERRPELPAPLVALVHDCLAKEPSRRPESARAVAEALAPFASERALSHDYALVVPSRTIFSHLPFPNELGRRKGALAIGAAAAVAAVVGLALGRVPRNPVSGGTRTDAVAQRAERAAGARGELPSHAASEAVPPMRSTDGPITPSTSASSTASTGVSAPPPAPGPASARRPLDAARPSLSPTRPVAKPSRTSAVRSVGLRPQAEDDDRIE